MNDSEAGADSLMWGGGQFAVAALTSSTFFMSKVAKSSSVKLVGQQQCFDVDQYKIVEIECHILGMPRF